MEIAYLGLAVIIILISFLPSLFRWRKTVRCPKCKKWYKLDYRGFNVRDKVVGNSSTSFGGGGVGGLFGRLSAFIFGHATRTNADPFIREWGTAYFTCTNCGCNIEIDTRRDRK
ncbi:hypothetical protein R84B8_01103 [Treponema sp. R8-4-B8]